MRKFHGIGSDDTRPDDILTPLDSTDASGPPGGALHAGPVALFPTLGSPPGPANVSGFVGISEGGPYTVAAGSYFYSNTSVQLISASSYPTDLFENDGQLWIQPTAALQDQDYVALLDPNLTNTGKIVSDVETTDQFGNYIEARATAVFSFRGNNFNSGQILADAADGIATAMFSEYSAPLTNSGIIAARSPQGEADGIRYDNGGFITNTATGKILADGLDPIAVYIGEGQFGTPSGPNISNAGLIEALSNNNVLAGVAIWLGGLSSDAMYIDNTGTIQGDIAILGDDYAIATTVQAPIQVVHNEAGGVIDGTIGLYNGDDVLTNDGTINGTVILGEGNDTFDNTNGVFNGPAALGWNDDTFKGGVGVDRVEGDDGNDVLNGNGGNDLLLGGGNDDVITGGAGNDGLYGEYGNDRIVTQGGDFVDAGAGNDRIELGDYTFAHVTGGDGFDTLVLPTGTRVIDLGLVAASGRVDTIEDIVLNGNKQIAIHQADVAAITGANKLQVDGAATDHVYLIGSWTASGNVVSGGVTYHDYTLGGQTVAVADGVGITVQSGALAGATGLDPVASGGTPLTPGASAGIYLETPTEFLDNYNLYQSVTVNPEQVWWTDGLDLGPVLTVENVVPNLTVYGGLLSDNETVGVFYTLALEAENLQELDNYGSIVAVATQDPQQTFSFVTGLQHGVHINNYGLVEAHGYYGEIVAAIQQSPFVLNTGTIEAISDRGNATGVSDFTLLTNQGTIIATSATAAIGIDDTAADPSQVSTNSGTITATDTGTGAGVIAAIGLEVDIAGGTQAFHNSGTITATVAVGVLEDTYRGGGALQLTNSGTLNGQVLLSAQADTVVNSGTINGVVMLGGGDDTYDGTGGHQTGGIYGGDGNDTIIDAVNATIDGGAGSDTVVFSGAHANYKIVVANGVATVTDLRSGAPDGTDTIKEVQFFKFSDGTFASGLTDDSAPTGGVTITGTATEKQVLSANTSTLVDTDGLGTLHYQWQHDSGNGSAFVNIGTDQATYTLGNADVNDDVRVIVSYTDGHGNLDSVTSAQTTPVVNVNDPPTGGIAIAGALHDGQTLSVDTSTLADADGLGTFSYLWYVNVGTDYQVVGNQATYTLRNVDVGHTFKVVITYIDGHGTQESVTSPISAVVTHPDNLPTGGVTITGTATEDQTLTANTATLADADGLGTLHYQWQRGSGTTFVNVGADQVTYTLGDADVGQQVRVVVSYTDGFNAHDSVTSGATTAVVNINDAPTLTGAGNTVAYTEQVAPVALDAGIVVGDVDNATLASASVGIASGFVTGDTLNFTNQNGISGSYNGATHVLTLTGASSLANYQAALRSVTFSSASDDPTSAGASTSRTIQWTVDDGQSLNHASSVATTTLNVTAVNDAPVLAGAGNTVSYTEQAAAIVLDGAITVADPDNATLTGAAVTIASGSVTGDTLGFTNQNGITGSFNATTHVLTLSGSASVASYQAALRSVTFSSASDDPTNATRTIQWTVDDGQSANHASNVATTTLNVAPVNDAPVLGGAGNTVAYTEQAAALTLDGAITVADADAATLAGATVTISSGFVAGDTLNFASQNGITGSYNAATHVLTLSGASSAANYQAALCAVTFSSASDDPTGATRTIQWTVDDGQSVNHASNTVSTTLNVTAVNDAPVLGGAGNTVGYTEQAAPLVLDGAITVADADNTTLTGAAVTIASGFVTGDTLNFINQNGITGSYNAATHVLTLSGGASVASYQAALRSVTFSSAGDNPDNYGASTSRAISWTVDDGQSANHASAAATTTLTITHVNDAPVLGGAGNTLGYTEQAAPVTLDNVLTVGDVDNTTLAGASVAISAGFVAGDTLNVLRQNGITGGYNAATHVLTLSGASSLANYQAALRSVTFSSGGDNPDNYGANPNRTITWTVDDGQSANHASNAVSTTLHITAVDDPASLHNDDFAANEDYLAAGASVFADNGHGADTDPDNLLHVTAVNGSPASVGQQITLASGALLTVGADGSVLYDPNHVFDYLAAPGSGATDTSATDTFTYTVNGTVETGTVTITGVDGNDTIHVGSGSDLIDGGQGTDTVVFDGNRADYTVTYSDATNQFTVVDLRDGSPQGIHTIQNVDALQFADTTVSTATQSFSDSYGDGSGAAWVIDSGGNTPWLQWTTRLDSSGSLASENFLMDNGTKWLNVYDTGGNGPYALEIISIDASNNVVTDLQTSHDGTHALTLYDTTNAYSWSSATIAFDASWNITGVSGVNDSNTGTVTLAAVQTALDTFAWYTTPYDPNHGLPIAVTRMGGGDIDQLYGWAGNDTLNGAGGNDLIVGGAGNDTLTGGTGDDHFVFHDGDGLDTITDFTAGDSAGDVIELHGYGVTSFTALQSLMTQAGSDTVITFDPNNVITLHNVTMGQLNSADFLLNG